MKKKFFIYLLFLCPVISVAQQNEIQLANEYYSQGAFEKARKLYDDLLKNDNNIPLIHHNYFELLIETGDYDDASKYIRRLIRRFPTNIYYKVDLVVLYHRFDKTSGTLDYLDDLINSIKHDTYLARIVADYLVNKHLPEIAVQVLKEARKVSNNPYLYALELANIYRIQNQKDLMVKEYLDFVSQNPSNLSYVKNTLQNLLVKPQELESLEMLLYDKIQADPNSEIYPELLVWVNLQQKNFYGAFIQSRAIDKRTKTEGSRTIDIGVMALQNNDYETAIKIFSYVTEEYPGTHNYMIARMYLIKSQEGKIKNEFPVVSENIRALVEDYHSFIDEMGINSQTLEALRSKALLHAFYLDEKDSAVAILNRLISIPQANPDLIAKAKLDLGDLYLLLNKPWESVLLYAQVEKSHKEETLGYEAKLKNAKLSYYKGDFKLALERLDILKQATTREIANDAMALSLLIKDNIAFDSTTVAMKQYAAVELLLFQNKNDSALHQVQKMRRTYSNHSLYDELLWLEADIQKKAGNFEASIALLQQIVDRYGEDILADDAFFLIGSIYDRQLSDKQKAMEYYRNFLKRYPGSVYVTEARKRFRALRGDFDKTPEL